MKDSTPEVSVWRLSQLEGKVDVLADKMDEMRELLIKYQCPEPGACVDLTVVVARLDKIVAAHEVDLNGIKTEIVVAKSNLRLIVAGASVVGGILGSAASGLFSTLAAKIAGVIGF